jgi:hypothetical protein
VFHVASVLHKNNFGIHVELSINHLVEERTLDLINIVGLSKSVLCLCLIPYRDVYGTLFNRLVVSFDNYNPEFTTTLIDQIQEEDLHVISAVLTMSETSMDVFVGRDDDMTRFSFANENRMYDVDPFFFFIGPRLEPYKRGTTRINSIKLYGKALSETDAEAILAGFQHT